MIRITDYRIIRIINPAGTEFRHIVKVRTVQTKTNMHSEKECYRGRLSEQSQLSLVLPLHCHIRTSLAGKFLIYAVISVPPPTLVHWGL